MTNANNETSANGVTAPLCPACRKGHLAPVERTRTFHPDGKVVEVQLLYSQCDVCAVEMPLAWQHDENLRRLAARKQHYGDTLMHEEIFEIRRRHCLTRKDAARVFGIPQAQLARFEEETEYPKKATRVLLALAHKHPEVTWKLAQMAEAPGPA